jgi:hypothetical protein
MKKVIITMSLLASLVWACKDAPKAETTATPPAMEVKKDTVAIAPKVAANLFAKDKLVGSWRSTVDKKSSIEFMQTDMKYVSNYAGEKVEEGTWDVPATCADCTVEAQDGCFFFKAEDGNDCCTIVYVTPDTLQYIVAGTTGKIQSFVRVNKK